MSDSLTASPDQTITGEEMLTGEKPFVCSYCDKAVVYRSKMKVHEMTHTKPAHLDIKTHQCTICSKFLVSRSSLTTHMKTHGEKAFECEFCHKIFTLKTYLTHHIRQTHTGERPFNCRHCPKTFSTNNNRLTHERIHTGEQPYSCEHCGKKFTQKSHLNAHNKRRFTNASTGGCPSPPMNPFHLLNSPVSLSDMSHSQSPISTYGDSNRQSGGDLYAMTDSNILPQLQLPRPDLLLPMVLSIVATGCATPAQSSLDGNKAEVNPLTSQTSAFNPVQKSTDFIKGFLDQHLQMLAMLQANQPHPLIDAAATPLPHFQQLQHPKLSIAQSVPAAHNLMSSPPMP